MTFEEELQEEINKFPYTKGLDDGQYNAGVLSGFDLGAYWGYNKALEDAAENAKVKPRHEKSPGYMQSYEVDKESILSLKK